MKPRLVTGLVLAFLGAALLILGLFCIKGPAFYLADPFLAHAAAQPIIITGLSGLLIGAITIASIAFRRV